MYDTIPPYFVCEEIRERGHMAGTAITTATTTHQGVIYLLTTSSSLSLSIGIGWDDMDAGRFGGPRWQIPPTAIGYLCAHCPLPTVHDSTCIVEGSRYHGQ